MEFDAVLIPPRRSTSIARGWWRDRTINDELDACVAACPDKIALVATSVEDGATTRFTYREMATMADRIAVGLARLGVGRNDVVSVQLPNWWQFTLTYLACSRIGAVMNPLMHIFRERELSFMLNHSRSKVMIVPKLFRGFDFERMMLGLQGDLPHLRHVVVVGAETGGQPGGNSFEALLCVPRWEQDADAGAILNHHRPGADEVTQLLYTSGTTGEPKGVMHTANTLLSNIVPYAEAMALDDRDVVMMASPMAHQTGFMYGLMMPIALHATAVLQDVWQPKKALEVIRAEHATFMMASTVFLTDLANTANETGETVPTLRTFLCAGAPIPGPLVERARKALDVKIVSAWGMTEMGAVTLTRLDDEDERSISTDGRPLPGVEVRIVDENGVQLPADTVGRLMARSCSNFAGYLGRPEFNATDADGWFETGDLAHADARGYIRIDGRSKDVIIRGGENIPVVEIEALLYLHPAIAAAAIVAYPDERLGERACAVVVPREGECVDLPGIVDFLKSHRVAMHYIPERLLVLDAMPVTPAGKIQKFRLRDALREAGKSN
ncbi:cyclohexanecarboxylate-CoA ligase [Burkholderia sp. Bp9017]|uniref:Cyclohexanecarboxylate-CoA ligase n=2 Tax=Burkholderia TaxID=32008 RepID=A0A7T6VL32_9BURK|nr:MULTISPECIES: cyclohexanecarboxylate-CoA ligase [Burkholderia]MBY4869666.1 cyclohexanecarboxylate-CoA ligase [Burkholderia anthina]QQK05932.1 cyclohexanecarboxylate-CoA ligase [Burkholderia anthina]RQZ13225.1 cyclohexanecarboxylate-CoA ligase [Burkholderia sp. Bp9017]RQZ25643.1 cyclohexanecarboxylate-CoA ligase [Burkholderia sp. Bp9016]